ncbi:MAG: sulfotransferase [Deltaproteobacteria bacterium]|nr:sulfotransferase [Deltaproteobacteria bacterium]
MRSRWDWIARAGVPTEVTRRLDRARGRVARRLARLAGVEDALAAQRETIAWQRARLDYLETLVAGLARRAPARPWRGAEERPVLLLGTGGGGTRVLAEAAARLGVVLGTRVNESFDSVEWAPLVYESVLAGNDAPSADAIHQVAESIYGVWLSDTGRWGLKLPELILVLPAFLRTFPAAQVVWLTRHPLAAALRRAHVTTQPDHPLGRVVLAAAYASAGRDTARLAGDAQHVRNALAWRYQVDLARAALAALPAERVLHLRLEDFAGDAPARLASFLSLPPAPVSVGVDAQRLAVPRGDPRAGEVLALCGPLATALGYD